jgi:hypothetical protein
MNFMWFSEQHVIIFININQHLCNGKVLCFVWGITWMFKQYLDELQLQRGQFNSYRKPDNSLATKGGPDKNGYPLPGCTPSVSVVLNKGMHHYCHQLHEATRFAASSAVLVWVNNHFNEHPWFLTPVSQWVTLYSVNVVNTSVAAVQSFNQQNVVFSASKIYWSLLRSSQYIYLFTDAVSSSDYCQMIGSLINY